MILLKHKVLKNIILRRTKKGRAADLALPPRIVSFPTIWLRLQLLASLKPSDVNPCTLSFPGYIEARFPGC